MKILRPDGRPSWGASTSDPLGLVVLLYIRDTLGIPHQGTPELPPLFPAVPSAESRLNHDRLSEQWNQRWAEATSRDGNADIGMESPNSPFFDRTPKLRAAYQQHLEPAARWAAPIQRARGGQFHAERARGLRDPIADLVAEWQNRTGREPAPFSLTIQVVPVEGTTAWTIAPLKFIVPQNLMLDRPLYTQWLRPIVESAAETK